MVYYRFSENQLRGGTSLAGRTAKLKVPYHGKLYTFHELSDLTGILATTLYTRWSRGYREDDLVCQKKPGAINSQAIVFLHKGKKTTFAQLSKESGINRQTLYTRWMNGARDEYLTRPVNAQTGKMSKYITDIDGKVIRQFEFQRKYHIGNTMIRTMKRKHWTSTELLEHVQAELDPKQIIEYQGHRYTVAEFGQLFNLDQSVVRARWEQGFRGDDLSRPD